MLSGVMLALIGSRWAPLEGCLDVAWLSYGSLGARRSTALGTLFAPTWARIHQFLGFRGSLRQFLGHFAGNCGTLLALRDSVFTLGLWEGMRVPTLRSRGTLGNVSCLSEHPRTRLRPRVSWGPQICPRGSITWGRCLLAQSPVKSTYFS